MEWTPNNPSLRYIRLAGSGKRPAALATCNATQWGEVQSVVELGAIQLWPNEQLYTNGIIYPSDRL